MRNTARILFALFLSAHIAVCASSVGPPKGPPARETQAARNPKPTATTAPLVYSPKVRKSSYADDRLFRDMTRAIGGVDFVGRILFPTATQRVLVRVEVVVPYDNRQTGIERWTIQHDGNVNASYIAHFSPDGKGGTNFAVSRDKEP